MMTYEFGMQDPDEEKPGDQRAVTFLSFVFSGRSRSCRISFGTRRTRLFFCPFLPRSGAMSAWACFAGAPPANASALRRETVLVGAICAAVAFGGLDRGRLTAKPGSADHVPRLAQTLVMPAQALQGDPQNDLARTGRPPHVLLGLLQPLQMTAAAQRDVAQGRGPVRAARRDHAGRASRPRPVRLRIREIHFTCQGPPPSSGIARTHLGQLEILAQPFARTHQRLGQKGPTVSVPPPGRATSGDSMTPYRVRPRALPAFPKAVCRHPAVARPRNALWPRQSPVARFSPSAVRCSAPSGPLRVIVIPCHAPRLIRQAIQFERHRLGRFTCRRPGAYVARHCLRFRAPRRPSPWSATARTAPAHTVGRRIRRAS